MSTQTATHTLPIALCEADEKAPEVIQLLPAGKVIPNDGRKPWLLDNPEAVLAETRKRLGKLDLLIDYNHQSEHAAKNGRPAPAAGWITELTASPAGIFGKVQWTDKAAAAVAAREFRYISPVFCHDAQGRVKSIVSCALTNTPALDMAALCESENINTEANMPLKVIAQALNLPETATEAEIVASCANLKKAACEAGREPDPAKYVPIAAHNAVLAELAALRKAQCEAEAASLVNEAKTAGKLAPAMEAWGKAYAESDPKGFRAWLEAAPDLGLNRETLPGKPEGKPGLTAEQKVICEAMGLDEAKYLEEAKKWQS